MNHARPIAASKGKFTLPLPATLFVVGLVLPIVFHLGTFRLSPYRLVLLAMFIPCIIHWLNGGVGRRSWPDVFAFLIAGWSSLAILRVHGAGNLDSIEAAGIVCIETLTPYLLARLCIRNASAFRSMVRLHLLSVIVLLPFALIEAFTARNAILELMGSVLHTYPDVEKPARLGLDRVQGPFEHPILFGVFCGSGFALGYFALGPAWRLARAALSASVAGLSLSSGPLSALTAQAALIVWDRLFTGVQGRWILLGALSVLAYLVVDLVSNRSPAEVFISYAAFNAQTAFSRVLIWEWTWINTWQNPWFGLGNNDWQRLWFMTDSVDMFWMHRTMVYGLPVGILYQLLFFRIMAGLVQRTGLDPVAAGCRKGLIVCLAGLYIAGMTVHYWNATFVWLMFLLGTSGWIIDGCATRQVLNKPTLLEPAKRTPRGLLAQPIKADGHQ